MTEPDSPAGRLLLEQYKEAANLCRNFEQVSRTHTIVYMGFFVAVSGLLERSDSDPVDTTVFSLLGLVGSTLLLYVGLQTRSYLRVYLGRAKEIERALGMEVYLRGDALVRTPSLLGFKLTIRLALLAIQAAGSLYFLGKLARVF